MNEIYVKDEALILADLDETEADTKLAERQKAITNVILDVLNQDKSKVSVQRWVPQIDYDESTSEEEVTEHIAHATQEALKRKVQVNGAQWLGVAV